MKKVCREGSGEIRNPLLQGRLSFYLMILIFPL
jgi:hypothetical protein